MSKSLAPVFAVQSNLWPTDQTPKVMYKLLDFPNLGTPIADDFILELESGAIETAQGAFIDNSDNAQSLTITFSVTRQRLVIPAFGQGTFPVFAGSSLQFSAATAGNVAVPLHLFNVPLPLAVWGPVQIGGGTGSLPVNPTQTVAVTKTTAAGTGADAVLLAANAARKSLQVMAPSGNAFIVQLAIGGATGALGQDYEITPGGVWEMPSNMITTQAIHVKVANGDNIVAFEGA